MTLARTTRLGATLLFLLALSGCAPILGALAAEWHPLKSWVDEPPAKKEPAQ